MIVRLLSLGLLCTMAGIGLHAQERSETSETSTRLTAGAGFVLRGVSLTGSTVLDATQVHAAAAPFLNRKVHIEELKTIQNHLSERYVALGYINSGVLLPDQDVINGKVVFRAVEGSLTEVRYLSHEPKRRSRLRTALEALPTPFRLTELQEVLRAMEQRPEIVRINGRVRPGDRLGDAVLDIDITRRAAYRWSLLMDNHRSPSIGAEAATLQFEHFDLTGGSDYLRLSLVQGEGRTAGAFRYVLPIFTATEIGFYGSTDGSEVVSSQFNALDIENDARSWGVEVRHTLIESAGRRVVGFFGADHSSSETELLNQPFSFSLGAMNGESTTFALQTGVEWIERMDNQVIAGRLSYRHGMDAFDATITRGDDRDRRTGALIPDGRFSAIVLQAQYARRLSLLNSQLVVDSTWQKALDPLLSVQKIALGGARTVRGYRENQLVRDEGVTVSASWRIPLGIDERGVDRWHLTLVPFVDYGRARDRNHRLSTGRWTTIRSVGTGLEWTPTGWFDVSVYWGHALDDDEFPTPQDRDIQDDGWHAAMRFVYPPSR